MPCIPFLVVKNLSTTTHTSRRRAVGRQIRVRVNPRRRHSLIVISGRHAAVSAAADAILWGQHAAGAVAVAVRCTVLHAGKW